MRLANPFERPSAMRRLDKRIDIQTPARVAVGDGYTDTWPALLVGCGAVIEPAAAGNVERIFGSRLQAAITALITMRWRSELTPAVLESARVAFGSRILQIRGWQNVQERNVWLVLACEELP